MAYIRKRKKSYIVVYHVNDADGTEHQKSEGKKADIHVDGSMVYFCCEK